MRAAERLVRVAEARRPHEGAIAEHPQIAARQTGHEIVELHQRFNAPRTSAADASAPPQRSIAALPARTNSRLLPPVPSGASSRPTRRLPPRPTAASASARMSTPSPATIQGAPGASSSRSLKYAASAYSRGGNPKLNSSENMKR